MPHRLLALLIITIMAGTAVGTVTSGATEPAFAVPRIPALAPLPASKARPCPVPAQHRAAFRRAAADAGVPLAMLVAVGQVESNLDHSAVSSAGARGLLQLMPATAAELRLDADHAPSNVLAGARYLRILLDRFHSPDLALAAYNAGPTAVERAGGAPTTATLQYVANVTTRWRSLTGCA